MSIKFLKFKLRIKKVNTIKKIFLSIINTYQIVRKGYTCVNFAEFAMFFSLFFSF